MPRRLFLATLALPLLLANLVQTLSAADAKAHELDLKTEKVNEEGKNHSSGIGVTQGGVP